jgi:hypothetical protein
MAEKRNGAPARTPAAAALPERAVVERPIVERVVVSPQGAPVTETALVLSDAMLAQLVLRGPLPSAR